MRIIGDSRHDTFEELCCQLAALDRPSQGVTFVRKGTPDAGVECYWKLANGFEVGWQAKFFEGALDNSRWSQLDSSFRTALNKHPALVRYIVCLPQDLADGRGAESKSARDKWNQRVLQWVQEAKALERHISIELWGQSQIFRRLARPSNRGLLWFFFETPSLTKEWFSKRLLESVRNAGGRHDQSLHVENAEQPLLDAFTRSNTFWNEYARLVDRIHSTSQTCITSLGMNWDVYASTRESLECLSSLMNRHLTWADLGSMDKSCVPMDWVAIRDSCRNVLECLTADFQRLAGINGEKVRAYRWDRSTNEYHYDRFSSAIHDLIRLCASNVAKAANAVVLLVSGSAGQGKTHTACQWALQLDKERVPVALLFGEQFTNDEPWHQIISRLGLSCDRDQFIGGLAAAARAVGRPALLILDALNEGPGNRLWRVYLAGLIECLRNEPWVRLCVTVRDIYESHVIPDLSDDVVVRIAHSGFSHNADAATVKFYEHYGLKPSTPLLDPEFHNPLFLKLFCKGIQVSGLTDVPRGLRGITAILTFFLDAVNKKLALELGYDEREKLVHRAVNTLASEMAVHGSDRVSLQRAKALIDDLHYAPTFELSLFRSLESETILATVPVNRSMDEFEEEIRFVYQRFADHLVARQMITVDGQLLSEREKRSESSVCRFLTDRSARREWAGLVDALAIQVPEKIGVEIYELDDSFRSDGMITRAVLESLGWRAVESFTHSLRDFLEARLSDLSETEVFWETIISFATVPNHPYNALWLHERLASATMSTRDALWSTFLSNQDHESSAVSRLINWCWQVDPDCQLDSEVVELAGITLCWFFTTPHRGIRDRATKASVNLYLTRIAEFIHVYDRFTRADDPYLAERVHAVACGVALRSHDAFLLSKLSLVIYLHIFWRRVPPENLLLRDYARLVIEYAHFRNGSINVDLDAVRPPYGTSWIVESEIPSAAELKRDPYPGGRIVDNDYCDFSKCVCDFDEWAPYSLTSAKPWSPDRIVREFRRSLTDRQRKLLLEVDAAHQSVADVRIAEHRRNPVTGDLKALNRELRIAIEKFEASLRRGSTKRAIYESDIRPYVRNHNRRHPPRLSIDSKPLRRWLQKRIRELAQSSAHSAQWGTYGIDRDVIETEESIAKKYAWIAVSELRSKLADNFEMHWAVSEDKFEYDGPWRINWGRDIDPTNTLRRTNDPDVEVNGNCWWAPIEVSDWHQSKSDAEWSEITTDLPDPREVIELSRPEDNSRWLTLHGYYQWMSPVPFGKRPYESVRRKIYFLVNSYLIHEADVEKVASWADRQRWMGRWMPENRSTYGVFAGEFFWSPHYKTIEDDNPARSKWSSTDQFGCERVPAPMLLTYEDYGWEHSASDSSLDDGVEYVLPSKSICEELQLRQMTKQAHWYDRKGKLVAFDPSVGTSGPSALVVCRRTCEEYMSRNKYAIFWTVLSERVLFGGGDRYEDYVGHVEANGAYILQGEHLRGQMKPLFYAKGTWTDPQAHRLNEQNAT